MITLDIKPLKLEDKGLIDSYLKKVTPETSELSFANLFMWQDTYHFRYTVIKDYLWIESRKQESPPFFLPPLGDDSGDLEASMAELLRRQQAQGQNLSIRRASKQVLNRMLAIPGTSLEWWPEPEHHDYLYRQSDLARLEGRKYHKKRNHIAQFMDMGLNWSYEPLTSRWLKGMRDLQKRWCEARLCHENKDILCEQAAVYAALDHYDTLDINGGVILVDDRVVAFCLGEMLGPDTLVVHIEKADTDIHGLYPLINREFARANERALYINREQDLGLAGLRRAKESYYPLRLVEKFAIVLHPSII